MKNRIFGDYYSGLIDDYNPILDTDFWIPIIPIFVGTFLSILIFLR